MYENQYMLCDMNQLEKSLKGIKAAAAGEREDELFYDYLISVAPTEEEKTIIASIRDDERGHNKMFRQIYRIITGISLPASTASDEEFTKPASYLEGIKKALFGELSAVEKYREIRRGLPSTMHRDILFNIITDEIKHSVKYNYLFTLNSHTMPMPVPMPMPITMPMTMPMTMPIPMPIPMDTEVDINMDMNMERTMPYPTNTNKFYAISWKDYIK